MSSPSSPELCVVGCGACAGSSGTDPGPAVADRPTGLTSSQAAQRLAEFGPNEPVRVRRFSALAQLAQLFANPLVIILLVASAISAAVGQKTDASIIFSIVTIGIAINFWQTYRSEQAADRLRSSVAPTATIQRDGEWQEIPLRAVVPGDLIHLSAGDLVPADARLVETRDLSVQQDRALSTEGVGANDSSIKTGIVAPCNTRQMLEAARDRLHALRGAVINSHDGDVSDRADFRRLRGGSRVPGAGRRSHRDPRGSPGPSEGFARPPRPGAPESTRECRQPVALHCAAQPRPPAVADAPREARSVVAGTRGIARAVRAGRGAFGPPPRAGTLVGAR